MSTRVSTSDMNAWITRSILQNQARVYQLSRGVADGKAVHLPSDDPVALSLAMASREKLRANGQYQKNVAQAQAHLSATDDALIEIEDIFTQARVLQVQGADDTQELDGRRALAKQVDQLIQQLVDAGNRSFGGTYLFGGTQTLEPPLQMTLDDQGQVADVTVNPAGIDGAVVRQVRPDLSLSIHLPGSEVFGEGQENFQVLFELRNALLSDDPEAIRAAGQPLADAQTRVVTAHAVVGALLGRVDSVQTQLEGEQVSQEAQRAQAEDLDLAGALLELNQNQTALQAALQVGSQILQSSLLDYIA
jgi:flagellar hook-associated protein 3 FlgL